jgi:hypothetical protein
MMILNMVESDKTHIPDRKSAAIARRAVFLQIGRAHV